MVGEKVNGGEFEHLMIGERLSWLAVRVLRLGNIYSCY